MNTEANQSPPTFAGKVEIKPQVVTSLALDAALSTYGIVGIASRYTGFDTTRHEAQRGLDVKIRLQPDGQTTVAVSIHVIVEYGVRISAVISSLQQHIVYSIEHSTCYVVETVNVNITRLHITHED